jgi:hypothetical protein
MSKIIEEQKQKIKRFKSILQSGQVIEQSL